MDLTFFVWILQKPAISHSQSLWIDYERLLRRLRHRAAPLPWWTPVALSVGPCATEWRLLHPKFKKKNYARSIYLFFRNSDSTFRLWMLKWTSKAAISKGSLNPFLSGTLRNPRRRHNIYSWKIKIISGILAERINLKSYWVSSLCYKISVVKHICKRWRRCYEMKL